MIKFHNTISKQQFLNEYWQKQPLLCRKALINPEQLISKTKLFELSLAEQVESRLLLEQGPDRHWQVFHGPQNSKQLQALENKKHWTLLVQSVNLWHSPSHQLLKAFDFIPQWRLDDVMISYASELGTVGPHIDHYDVFLIQLSGSRRWKVGKPGATVEYADETSDIRHIKSFEPMTDELLEPGDMIYVPPETAHFGVSHQPGMTLSIGFRSPALSEMLMIVAEQLVLEDKESYLSDPIFDATQATAEISAIAMTKAVNWMSDLDSFAQLTRKSFGLLQTQPKQALLLNPVDISLAELLEQDWDLIRDPAARIAWYQVNETLIWLFINGEYYQRPIQDKSLINALSNKNILPHSYLANHTRDDAFIILLQIFVDSGFFGLK